MHCCIVRTWDIEKISAYLGLAMVLSFLVGCSNPEKKSTFEPACFSIDENGNHAEKKSDCHRRCENGELELCVDLGDTWRIEEYGGIDENKAMYYYRKACDGLARGADGNTLHIGCSRLGGMLENRGDKASLEQAVKYYDIACAKGFGFDCGAIASIYSRDPERSEEARLYAQKACDLKYVQACRLAKEGSSPQ